MKFWLVVSFVIVNLLPCANATSVRFAVGPDHQQMMDNNYAIYKANWDFLSQSLALLDAKLIAKPMPWARAKASVQSGENHGLFLAANFEERNKWAILSKTLGYEVFGCFLNVENPEQTKIIAAVRLGGNDKILSYLNPDELLNVATAKQGLNLLHSQRIDRFIMSKGYGQYILKNELPKAKVALRFEEQGAERRSLHVAFAKENKGSQAIVALVNRAITLGIEKGLYHRAMTKYQVPHDMLLTSQ